MSRIIEHLRIPLKLIKSATKDFGDDNYIGAGGFGKVYKGQLRDSTVAVKRLDDQGLQGNSEFWKEITMLSEYKHENIVSLIGLCDDSGEKILVYEYPSRESLDLYIPSAHLGWIQRLKICVGAARGLQYLHYPDGTQQRIIHRDIKSSNILLDEDWRAKISDFGLSRLSPANQPNSGIVTGTLGYCDPLYVKEGILTKESDVYSFGVVLYEVLCGRLCHTSSNGGFRSFVDLARYSFENNKLHEIFYDRVSDDINPESLKAFATIAYRCVNKARKDRPTMIQVVNELKIALGHQLNTYTPLEDASCEDLGELNRDTSFEVALRYDFGKMLFGCKHLRSRCKLRAPCCKRIFPCRRCHDEYTSELRNPDERHKMVSRDVNRVICTICQTEQPVGHICGNCGAKMGEYFCRVCKLYDDDTSKGQFHCDDCGICRLDGRENFFHCHACGSCIHVSRRRTHTYTCSKNALRKAWESILLL